MNHLRLHDIWLYLIAILLFGIVGLSVISLFGYVFSFFCCFILFIGVQTECPNHK